MGDEDCSWTDCYAEVVAWIDSRAWCGRHAVRVLDGDRPVLADDAGKGEESISALRRVTGDAA